MEYVLVVYPTNRKVYVNDDPCGRTNKAFRVNPGSHKFDLGSPQDYEPGNHEIEVINTSPLEPLEIVFSKKNW